VADRDIQVVKTARCHPQPCQSGATGFARPHSDRQETVLQESTNFYASNLDLGSIPPLFLYQLGRSRWQIDANVFQTLTTECSLQQSSLHQGYEKALIVLTMIRVLVYTLSQVFYHRQVRSHIRQPDLLGFRDCAQRMAYLSFRACGPRNLMKTTSMPSRVFNGLAHVFDPVSPPFGRQQLQLIGRPGRGPGPVLPDLFWRSAPGVHTPLFPLFSRSPKTRPVKLFSAATLITKPTAFALAP
jgi:hypothetical protein